MRIRTRTLVIMASQMLVKASTILLGIFLVRIVSDHVYGTFRQTFLVYGFLAAIISLQLPKSLYYFIPKLGPAKLRRLLVQTFLAVVASGVVTGTLLFVFSEPIAQRLHNPSLAPLLRIFALFPITEGIMTLVPAYMISLDRALRAGLYALTMAVSRTTLVVAAFLMGWSLESVLWVIIATNGTLALVAAIDMARLAKDGRWAFSKQLLLTQIDYVWPLWLTGVVAVVNVQFDKLLISYAFDPSSYAVYSVGAINLPILDIVVVSIASAITPNLVSLVDGGDTPGAIALWHKGIRKASLIIFPAAVFFMVEGDLFIRFLYGDAYGQASLPFRIYLLALPFRVAMYASLFRSLGFTKPIAISAILGAGTNVVVGVSLVTFAHDTALGFAGPAVGTLASVLAIVGYLMMQLKRHTGMTAQALMRWRELAQVMLAAMVAVVPVMLLPVDDWSRFFALAAGGVVYALSFAGILLGLRLLLPDELSMLRTALRRLGLNSLGGRLK